MVQRLVLALLVAANPAVAAGFDTDAYCKKVSAAVGGSYQVESHCRSQEDEARRALAAESIPPEIGRYCDKVAGSIGGSYQVKKTCVAQEKAAKSGLR